MQNVQNGNNEVNEEENEEEEIISENNKKEGENLSNNEKNEENTDNEIEKNEENEENEEAEQISTSQHATLNDSSKKIVKKNYFQKMDHSRLHHLKEELKDNTFLVSLFLCLSYYKLIFLFSRLNLNMVLEMNSAN